MFSLRKPRTVCPLFRHQEQEKQREKETELDDSFLFLDRMQYCNWFVDGKRSSLFPFRFCSLSIAHAPGKRRSSELKIHTRFQMGALVERFKCSVTLRVSLPVLSKSLKKALLYRCKKEKVHTCMATESKQNPAACVPVSSCELLLPLFVWLASMRMAGSKQTVSFSLNGCRERTEPE